MKTLSSAIDTQKDAEQSAWCHLYDIYLKSAIVTPWGTTAILRLTDLPVGSDGFDFFKPKISPEALSDQGDDAVYYHWPLQRSLVKSDSKFANDKMQISASNVTQDWEEMIEAIEWRDTPLIIRKVETTIAAPTADDCVVLWSGKIDSAKIADKQLAFECSSDLAALSMTAPRENMHTNCRARWADDTCTQIRFRSTNYKSKTVGTASSDAIVKSAGLNEDTATAGSYGTDLVDALSDGAITTSSEKAALTAAACTPQTNDWIRVANDLEDGQRVKFAGTSPPGGITFGTWYYVRDRDAKKFKIAATLGGAAIDITSLGTTVNITSEFGFEGFNVKASNPTHWSFATAGDWGNQVNGFYQIPDAQAGLANAALKPYIQFDFGSAKQPRVWRISSVPDVRMEELPRLLVIFSSSDNATWKHETYFELPPKGGILYDVLIPTAASARYWRICVRSRWANSLYFMLLNKVYAYEDSRHWWARGRITFASNTTTAELRNISRRVLESYSGQVTVAKLPAAPVNGDTFIIERGCSGTFNACCERQNWENFAGFTDLPYQAVVR